MLPLGVYSNPQLNDDKVLGREMQQEDTYNGEEGIDVSSFSFILKYKMLEVIRIWEK